MGTIRFFIICVVFLLGCSCTTSGARGLKGNPPGLGMSVQELFGKWLEASGGEAAWKSIFDIKFDLIGTTSFSGLELQRRERHVHIKLQPRLRIHMEFIDEKKRRTVYGHDSKGWFKYREDVPVGTGPWDWRLPNVYGDFASQDEVSYELKGIGFWLGLPFIVQLPETKLRFAGFLKPLEAGNAPLPIIEVDLTDVGDWPIDMVIVALDPSDWQPVEARYRFRGEDKMPYTVVFFDFAETHGIRYPRTRVFYDDTKPQAEREEIMTNVVANTWVEQARFERPGWRQQWK